MWYTEGNKKLKDSLGFGEQVRKLNGFYKVGFILDVFFGCIIFFAISLGILINYFFINKSYPLLTLLVFILSSYFCIKYFRDILKKKWTMFRIRATV